MNYFHKTHGLRPLTWIANTLLLTLCCFGCGTTINRVATEQLLLSDAVDDAVNQIDFSHFRGRRCYLDTNYLRQNTNTGIVNSEYIVSSLRQQIVTAGALLQELRTDADIVIEPRIGALGTDGHEIVYGVPQGGSIASAANALSGTPVPLPAIPEIAFGKNDSQSGIAKVSVFAYDRVSRKPIWQSGIAKAETTSNNTWVLGAGPFQKGTVYEGLRFAGRKIPDELGLLNESEYADRHQMERLFSDPQSEAARVTVNTETNSPNGKAPKSKQNGVSKPASTARIVNYEEVIPTPPNSQSLAPLRPEK